MTRAHLLAALAEHDARGGAEFLDLYGFEAGSPYTLVHEGRVYDVIAILGVAHRFATGRLATPGEFASGIQAAVAILRKRGFEVSEPASASYASPPRAARAARSTAARSTTPRPASARAAAVREAPAAICPTCFMTLPATGICDQCG